MNWHTILSLICAFAAASSGAIYAIDTLKGKTQPNRVSFLFWSVPLLAGFASVSVGFSWAMLATFATGLMPLLVFVCSFVNKKAYWKLGAADYICGVFALAALVLWLTVKDPVLTIVFSIIADVLATIPTAVKCFKYPESETKLSYVIYLAAHSANLLNLESREFVQWAFPVYLVLCNIVLTTLVYWKSLFPPKKETRQPLG